MDVLDHRWKIAYRPNSSCLIFLLANTEKCVLKESVAALDLCKRRDNVRTSFHKLLISHTIVMTILWTGHQEKFQHSIILKHFTILFPCLHWSMLNVFHIPLETYNLHLDTTLALPLSQSFLKSCWLGCECLFILLSMWGLAVVTIMAGIELFSKNKAIYNS